MDERTRALDEPAADRPEATAELAEELLLLASADNFRDVAGEAPGHPTSDGGRVRRGVFYRSNELQLSEEDVARVAALGVTGIADLRGEEEVAHHPDAPVPGATWRHFAIAGIPMGDLADLPDRRSADDVMRRVYRGFVADPRCRASFAALLRHLATAEGPQLFHCTAGKDRTGWTAALLLHLAGVDDETVLADYLLTNERSAGTREKYLGLVAEGLGPDRVPVYERVLVADAAYLDEAYAAVDAAYGSRLGYLRDGLGLDDDALDALRARLRG